MFPTPPSWYRLYGDEEQALPPPPPPKEPFLLFTQTIQPGVNCEARDLLNAIPPAGFDFQPLSKHPIFKGLLESVERQDVPEALRYICRVEMIAYLTLLRTISLPGFRASGDRLPIFEPMEQLGPVYESLYQIISLRNIMYYILLTMKQADAESAVTGFSQSNIQSMEEHIHTLEKMSEKANSLADQLKSRREQVSAEERGCD